MRPETRAPLAWAVATLLAAAPAASAASLPPWFDFRTLSTERVAVHFHQGLERLARQAASLAAEILEAHEARYGVRVPRLNLVLCDPDDDPNGFATPLPYPLVQIRVAAPDGTDEFGNYEGWLRLVLTHELAHVVHLEPARGLPGLGRTLLGRAPFLFPNALTPAWMLEGLATYEETEGTGFGRGRNPDSRMVLRMAALEGRFPSEDVPATFPDDWPSGLAPYLFGEAFLRDLSVRFGRETLPALARTHSGWVLPFLDELTSARVTGATFHTRWKEWRKAAQLGFEDEAAGIAARGITPSRAVTSRGVSQTGPRLSPDGRWIAYTSRTLTRFGAIRLVRPDGSGDYRLTDRAGGTGLAWTPDGRRLIYDEPEAYRLFAVYSDLKAVDVASGRVRRLSSGLRAHDPDVSPDGKRLVFVRRVEDRSEVWTLELEGGALHPLTESGPGTQWSGPRFSPDGARVAAARWSEGGWLDLFLIDAESGALTRLTEDRARDMEPEWTPDGGHLVFRSDRDGVSNLYALRLDDRALLRVGNVLGGAFHPSLGRDGRQLAFADYSSRGLDVRIMDLALAGLPPADPYRDDHPAPRPLPAPFEGEPQAYRPLAAMLPRFWTPYVAFPSGETQLGAVTGGNDPLFRHLWGADLRWGSTTRRASAAAFYQYDRFRPTLLLTASDSSEPDGAGALRTQEVGLQADLPLVRSFRWSQSASLAWRFKRQAVLEQPDTRLDLGGLEVAWAISSVRRYPYSISPAEGWRLRLAALKEDPALGSDVSLAKLTGDLRTYQRLFGESDALAVRLGGGVTFGRASFTRSFAVGGFPQNDLFDVVRANLGVLRGYPDYAFTGRNFAVANLEYRFPLAHPQRGYRLLPAFVRHLHGSVFADAGHAWTGSFRLQDVKTGAGAALGVDFVLGHGLPLTATAGLAYGFAEQGSTRSYFRMGLAF
jgi:Tol biopolymer transport system component